MIFYTVKRLSPCCTVPWLYLTLCQSHSLSLSLFLYLSIISHTYTHANSLLILRFLSLCLNILEWIIFTHIVVRLFNFCRLITYSKACTLFKLQLRQTTTVRPTLVPRFYAALSTTVLYTNLPNRVAWVYTLQCILYFKAVSYTHLDVYKRQA